MATDKDDLICELTGEQFEAALNVACYLRDERSAGRKVDLRRVRGFRVYRHKRDARARVIELVGEDDQRGPKSPLSSAHEER